MIFVTNMSSESSLIWKLNLMFYLSYSKAQNDEKSNGYSFLYAGGPGFITLGELENFFIINP